MTRKTLTDLGVRALKPRAKRYAHPDPALAGHYVRVQPSGVKSFCAVARNPSGKQIWTTIGATEVLPIAEARTRAREIIRRVHDGLPAVEPPAKSFGAVVGDERDNRDQDKDTWLKRHVDASGLRSSKEIRRLLREHVLPRWKDREFTTIRRSDVVTLLNEIEDDHGSRQADLVLAIVSKVMNWFAVSHDDYNSPLVKGMRRWKPKDHERKRVLDDDELRAVWMVAEDSGKFGALVRLLLLSAQRLQKVAAMRWQDVAMDGVYFDELDAKQMERLKTDPDAVMSEVAGVWTIPTEPREKGNAGELVLPRLALDIIRAQPRFAANDYVLAGRGNGHTNDHGANKRVFDEKLAKVLPNMPRWTLHDLRRTSRSLMSRAGVSSEHAEKILGHSVGGVEGIYDRHKYAAEKADALKRLAALIDPIIHPRPATVVPLKARR